MMQKKKQEGPDIKLILIAVTLAFSVIAATMSTVSVFIMPSSPDTEMAAERAALEADKKPAMSQAAPAASVDYSAKIEALEKRVDDLEKALDAEKKRSSIDIARLKADLKKLAAPAF